MAKNQRKQHNKPQPKAAPKAAPKRQPAQRVRPLFEVNVQMDGKSLSDLRTSAVAAVSGLVDKAKQFAGDAVETLNEAVKEDPEGAKSAGQAIVNLLGMFGVKEVNFKGTVYRPDDEDAAKKAADTDVEK